MMTFEESAKEDARLYFNTFEFNGYYLNKRSEEVQKEFAKSAIELLLMNIDYKYLRMYWNEVIKQIEKL